LRSNNLAIDASGDLLNDFSADEPFLLESAKAEVADQLSEGRLFGIML
jgi:hypothetical protein